MRTALAYGALLGLLALLGVSAWLTHHPDAPLLDRVAEWDAVEGLVAQFRERYGVAHPSPPSTGPTSAGTSRPPELVVIEPTIPNVWVSPGTPLRASPSSDAPLVGRAPGYEPLDVRSSDDGWYQVEWAGEIAWVHLPGYESVDRPLGSEPEPVLPLRPEPPAPDRLAAVTDGLDPIHEARVGPYRCLTDVEDGVLLHRLDAVAAGLEGLYRSRFGVAPIGAPAAVVVLYRRPESYRRYQAALPRIAALPAAGHSEPGLAVLYQGDRSPAAVAGTLVHELTHLMNRGAVGPALPPWLDEGMADAFGTSSLDDRGRLDPGRLGGERLVSRSSVTLNGGLASLSLVRARLDAGRLTPLSDLIALEWESFVGGQEGAPLHYAHAGLFVRFLLDGEPGLANGFRMFLGRVRAGEQPTAELLLECLGRPEWDALELAFRGWLRFSVAEADLVERAG